MRRSTVLPYLNEYMPPGIMVILVFYTVRNTPLSITPLTVAVAAGLITTAGLHVWRSNATTSVLGGTAAHVILASTLPSWS
jgi:branched-subunit amino acid transport protein AzlD